MRVACKKYSILLNILFKHIYKKIKHYIIISLYEMNFIRVKVNAGE